MSVKIETENTVTINRGKYGMEVSVEADAVAWARSLPDILHEIYHLENMNYQLECANSKYRIVEIEE